MYPLVGQLVGALYPFPLAAQIGLPSYGILICATIISPPCWQMILSLDSLEYTDISRKVVLQKHKTLNSECARDDG